MSPSLRFLLTVLLIAPGAACVTDVTLAGRSEEPAPPAQQQPDDEPDDFGDDDDDDYADDDDDEKVDDDDDVGDGDGDGHADDKRIWEVWLPLEDGGIGEEIIEGYVWAVPDLTPTLRCEMFYMLENPQQVNDCAECDEAWSFVRGEPFEIVDNGGCEEIGALGQTGTTIRLGWRGEDAFRDFGDGWEQAGITEVYEEKGHMREFEGPIPE